MISGIERFAPWENSGTASEPLIIVANHSSWWDAILPIVISRGARHHEGYGLMERAQLDRYGFFRQLGILPIDRDNPRRALATLGEIAAMMRGERRVLWIFPQGRIVPNDRRPIEVESGTARLIRMIGDCSIVPVAFRYEMGREELPAAYIRIGEVGRIAGDAMPSLAELNDRLVSTITANLDGLREEMSAESFPGYAELLRGRASINRRWDAVRGKMADGR
jgi:1-acyl-sn-glycerol-3-phosphate acyltransferase